MPGYTQQKYYMSVSTPLGADKFLISQLKGVEAVSEPFFFELEMESEDAAVDLDALIGKEAVVTFLLHGGGKRYIHGRITRMMVLGGDVKFKRYRAEIRPWFWFLTLMSDCRIFQNLTVPEIVEAECKRLGFTDFRNELTSTYDKREYCVQYNESSFQFLSRLMEDEGIFYYFEHTDSKHTLVFADDAAGVPTVPGAAKLRGGQPRSGDVGVADNWIEGITFEQSVTTGACALGDYFFETPKSPLSVKIDGSNSSRSSYAYPGGFTTTGTGEGRARVRLQEAEAQAKILRAGGQSRALLPGYQFTLEEQARSELNVAYVISEVSHQASQQTYRNTFHAFPAAVPFRPPRVTPRPRVFGCQTAVVTGKSGEEIWTDEYGRIKVHFHWDRAGAQDETSSCWIRVDQGWAGRKWGSLFLPRIGQEVLVTFLEGDPDRPVVSGALYNADQTVPYGLPAEQTKSTLQTRSTKNGSAGNEIRFEDKLDSEELYVHAQKDYNISVENSRTTTIIKGDDSLKVSKGKRDVEITTGNETHTNGADFTHTVKGNYSLKVQGNLTIEATGSITIKAGTSFDLKAGTALSAEGGVSLSTKAPSISQKADASQTVDGGGLLTLKGGLVKIN